MKYLSVKSRVTGGSYSAIRITTESFYYVISKLTSQNKHITISVHTGSIYVMDNGITKEFKLGDYLVIFNRTNSGELVSECIFNSCFEVVSTKDAKDTSHSVNNTKVKSLRERLRTNPIKISNIDKNELIQLLKELKNTITYSTDIPHDKLPVAITITQKYDEISDTNILVGNELFSDHELVITTFRGIIKLLVIDPNGSVITIDSFN
jgi:predicted RNA-binding protein